MGSGAQSSVAASESERLASDALIARDRRTPAPLDVRDDLLHAPGAAGEAEGDEKTLGDLVSLKGVVKYPVRIKCALLPLKVLKATAYGYQGWPDKAPFDADGPGTSDLDLTLVGADVIVRPPRLVNIVTK